MGTDLRGVYKENIKEYSSLFQKANKKSKAISLFRLFDFIVAAILIYIFARLSISSGIIITIIASILLFIYLIKYHSKVLLSKKLYESLIKINKEELELLVGKYDNFDKGEEFEDPGHPYASDVDIFGEGSLFQYLNRSASIIGKQELANLLCHPHLDETKILDNQESIKELVDFIDWRQHFQAIGITYKEKKSDHKRILEWVQELPIFNSSVFTILVYLIPVLSAFMIFLLSINIINFNVFLIYLLIPWGISGSYAFKVNRRHNLVSKTSEMLIKYALLLKEIEDKKFNASKLNDLQNKLQNNGISAGLSIKKLSSILVALDNRLNFVSWSLFNGLMLWDILQMKRLEHWQVKHKNEIKKWFEVVEEFDSLNSFSNFYFNNKYASFPELQTEKFSIESEDMGHPLINQTSRVNNSICIKPGEFVVITGANMAGKSTFLRTIVINMIMAMCGAPVCAEKFSFKPIRIFTSIRTNDSLHKNESYFYSELKRLKYIIETLKSNTKLFVVLDEILKGTNSKDKHRGSEALLKQFISLNTSGIVATHDVALGKLEETFPQNIKNKSFEVDINGSQLSFDYKLREGVSKNMNATILMKEMGITV